MKHENQRVNVHPQLLFIGLHVATFLWYLVEHDGKEHYHLDSSLVCSCSRSKRNSISCTQEKRWSQPMSLLIILASKSDYFCIKTLKAILKFWIYHTWENSFMSLMTVYKIIIVKTSLKLPAFQKNMCTFTENPLKLISQTKYWLFEINKYLSECKLSQNKLKNTLTCHK